MLLIIGIVLICVLINNRNLPEDYNPLKNTPFDPDKVNSNKENSVDKFDIYLDVIKSLTNNSYENIYSIETDKEEEYFYLRGSIDGNKKLFYKEYGSKTEILLQKGSSFYIIGKNVMKKTHNKLNYEGFDVVLFDPNNLYNILLKKEDYSLVKEDGIVKVRVKVDINELIKLYNGEENSVELLSPKTKYVLIDIYEEEGNLIINTNLNEYYKLVYNKDYKNVIYNLEFYNNMRGIKSFLLIIILAFCGVISNINGQNKTQMNAQKLGTTLYLIENFYTDTVNLDKVTEDAIIAALKELDPHSAYISKKDVEKANEQLVGSFEGIGVTFQLVRDTITVIGPTAGGPSERVGILAGDKFVKIDGEDAVGKKIDNEWVQKHLRGKKGTKVTVTVKRGNDPELMDFEIIRDKIPLNSINAFFMMEKNVGYIKLDRFAQESTKEFKNALADLKKRGMKSLILDLRSNTGGYLNTAIELVDQFLKANQLIVYTEGLHSPRQEWKSTDAGDYTEGKLVVLIDEGSASASEILSGAVQDHDRGVIIGRRSFGKGLVQRPFNLPDGAVIRLTTARYHTPTGRCIQRPYEEGTEEYYKEMTKRLEHGEYFHADSIHFPDSLKYKTDNGRVVYGGGGIMPDIFMPIDTSFNSKLYTNLVRKGVFNKYTVDYAMANRENLKKQYPEFSQFNKDFQITDAMMEEVKAVAEKEKVTWNDEEYQRSEKYIKLQIKALIARNVWEMQQYYEVTLTEDPTIKKAMEVVGSDRAYKNALR